MAFSKKVSILLEGKETVSNASRKAADSVDDLGRRGESAFSGMQAAVISVNQGLELLQKGAQAAQQVIDRMELGAKAMQIERAFGSMAQQVGADADQVIEDLQRMSRATISETDLMTAANRAMLFEIPVDKLDELMEIARASATATGASVSQMFNDIVTGIARSSPMILDNLGLTLKIGDATEAYAAELGKTAEELTASERKQATLNATLEAGGGIIERMGEVTADVTDLQRIQQYQSAWENLQSVLNSTLVDVFEPMLTAVTNIVTKLTEMMTLTQEAKALREAAAEGAVLTLEQQLTLAQERLQSMQNQIAAAAVGGARSPVSSEQLAMQQMMVNMLERVVEQHQRAIEANTEATRENTDSGGTPEDIEHSVYHGVIQAIIETPASTLFGQNYGGYGIPGVLPSERERATPLGDISTDILFGGAWPAMQDFGVNLEDINSQLDYFEDTLFVLGHDFEEASRYVERFYSADRTPEGAGFEPADYTEQLTAQADALAYWGSVAAGVLESSVSQIGTLNALLNPLNTLMAGYLNIVGTLLNSAYVPLVNMILVVGEMFGAILAPWIETVGGLLEVLGRGFLWFYNNVLRHVGNVIISIFNIVQMAAWGFTQAIVNVVNSIIGLVNDVRTFFGKDPLALWQNPLGEAPRDLNEGWLERISLEDFQRRSADYGFDYTGPGSGPTGGDNTTVARQPDIYVYQTFNGPIIGAGGLEEVGRFIAESLIEYTNIGASVNVILGENG